MAEKRERKGGIGGFGLIDILCPFLIPVRGVAWVGSKLKDTAEAELTDESKVQEELLELQMRFEMDEITEEEYEKKEAKLMEKLEAIRKYKEGK
ncbi:MAG: gas vesicle protein GvpG [Actinomycetota bacterium]|nr:gas vesicle protein GvpG [Actinomycetota bacterium]